MYEKKETTLTIDSVLAKLGGKEIPKPKPKPVTYKAQEISSAKAVLQRLLDKSRVTREVTSIHIVATQVREN